MSSWQYLEQLLLGQTPAAALRDMRDRDVLGIALPEVDALFGVPQSPDNHPEIDSGVHTLLVLEQACLLSDDLGVRAAALLHDVGKAATPHELWPSHKGHEQRGVPIARGLLDRTGAPDDVKAFSLLAVRWHGLVHKASEASDAELSELAEAIRITGQADAVSKLGLVCMADSRGRPGYEHVEYASVRMLRERLAAL